MELKEKYNLIKEKFYKNFIAVGDPKEKGTNIPALTRHEMDKDSNIMNWGDSLFSISNHIGVLATEYNLLLSEKKDTNDTLIKLYYSLLTVERLDRGAESSFRHTGEIFGGDLNGFFIRDDVDNTILKRYPNLKKDTYSKTQISSIYSDLSLKVNDQGVVFAGSSRDREMSQDQVWGLLPGLSLVIKTFEDREYIFKIDEDEIKFNFKRFSQELIHRIITYMKDCKWVIQNPPYNKKVSRGAEVSFNVYAFAKCCDVLCQGSGLPKIDIPWYSKAHYLTTYYAMKFLYYTILPLSKKLKSKVPVRDYSFTVFETIGKIGFNSKGYIKNQFNKRKYFPHMYLLYSFLNDKKSDINKTLYEELLLECPVDNYNFNGDYPNYNWSNVDTVRNNGRGSKASSGYYSG